MSVEPAATPGRRLPPPARRAQLLAVAEEVFTRLGYQGTSMEDIASAAGVTRPLIYNYFADKDELYLECARAARTELEAAFIAAVAQHSTAADQLRAGMTAYFAFVESRGRRWDMLFGGGSAVAGPIADEVARLRFDTAEKISALVLAAAPHVAPVAASAYAHVISGAGEQLAKWWRRHPDVPLATVVQLHLDAVWGGLREITSRP